MMPICLSCHVKSNGMIAIYQHPNGLDEMFHSITGIEVEANDHLCVPCYDDLKSAHGFKQRCIQNNVVRLSGQSSKKDLRQPAVLAEQSATSSSADVSTTCEESRPAPEASSSAIKSHTRVVKKHVQPEEDDCEEKHLEEESAREDDLKEEDSIEYIIDLNIENDEEEEHIHSEAATNKEGVCSEDEHDDSANDEKLHVEVCSEVSPTDSQSEELHGQTQHPEGGELKDEGIVFIKPAPRLPKTHSLMCEFCFKEFKTLADKIDHTEAHRSEQKPFKCFHEGCSSSFKDRVGLRAHVRIHAVVKRFGCRYCAMRFHTRSNRNAHERTHNGEKPYVCSDCGKGFAEAGNLKSHKRFHTGERPYSCTICNKSYRTHYSRSVHMRSHTNDRPFVCADCGKGFYSSGKLKIHRRIHTGEKPYGCGSCDLRFVDRYGLRRHQIKAH